MANHPPFPGPSNLIPSKGASCIPNRQSHDSNSDFHLHELHQRCPFEHAKISFGTIQMEVFTHLYKLYVRVM